MNRFVEIATDKVDSEVPAPTSGVLKQKVFNDGDVVQVGAVFAIIGAEGEETIVNAPTMTKTETVEVVTEQIQEELLAPIEVSQNGVGVPKNGPSGRFYSPLVRSIAKTEGISVGELESVAGTGQEGRVTKKDILGYIETRTEDSGNDSKRLLKTVTSPPKALVTK